MLWLQDSGWLDSAANQGECCDQCFRGAKREHPAGGVLGSEQISAEQPVTRPELPKSSSQSATPMGLLHSDQSGVFRITVPASQQRQFRRRKGPDADSVVLPTVLIRRLQPVAADL